MEEYICRDGRMSVNGICAIDQKDSSETYDTTQTIIDVSKDNKILDDLAKDGTPDYYPDLGKEKKSFNWDMDKPSAVKDFTTTMNQSIEAYNNFIEENLGIPANVQNTIRTGAAISGLMSGSALAAIGPFALPALIGNAMRGKENERVQTITDSDKQGDINTIDMMTYGIPSYGEKGFNIHNDAKDKSDNTPSGPQNQMESDFGYGSDAGFY
jgi:hypothetical protein